MRTLPPFSIVSDTILSIFLYLSLLVSLIVVACVANRAIATENDQYAMGTSICAGSPVLTEARREYGQVLAGEQGSYGVIEDTFSMQPALAVSLLPFHSAVRMVARTRSMMLVVAVVPFPMHGAVRIIVDVRTVLLAFPVGDHPGLSAQTIVPDHLPVQQPIAPRRMAQQSAGGVVQSNRVLRIPKSIALEHAVAAVLDLGGVRSLRAQLRRSECEEEEQPHFHFRIALCPVRRTTNN